MSTMVHIDVYYSISEDLPTEYKLLRNAPRAMRGSLSLFLEGFRKIDDNTSF